MKHKRLEEDRNVLRSVIRETAKPKKRVNPPPALSHLSNVTLFEMFEHAEHTYNTLDNLAHAISSAVSDE